MLKCFIKKHYTKNDYISIFKTSFYELQEKFKENKNLKKDEGEGKKILESKIKKEYPSLSKNNVKQILKLKFSGWGRFSKKFLTEIISDFTGFNEKINIITAMRKTNSNLMELLSDNYNFKNSIEKFNGKFKSEKESLSYNNLVKNLYVSPSVKRMMWQSLCIVKELKKIQGNHEPKKIFVEMARGEELNKGRTKSRQKKLEELYENCKENANEWSTDISSLKDKVKNVDNLKLRSDKLYLYYTQMGKCMYTGRAVDLNNLMNKNLYDIDHIYPQSKIKDDSFNSRVLFCSKCNQNKKDKYPILPEIQNKQKSFWHFLQRNEFITMDKLTRLTRLTRSTALTDDEISKFIARQLVETRQATKEIAKILKKIFPNSEIVYVKAGLVSFFRNKFNLIKCREINDVHHAHDAYLNIVVGNVYNTKYTNNPRNFIKQKRNEFHNASYNFFKAFDYDVVRNNKIAWKKESTITDVKDSLKRNTILYTRYAYCKTGGLFDQTIMKKTNGQMPLKSKGVMQNINKYGGYNSISIAYYILVEYKDGNDYVRSLECVPLYLVKDIGKDKEILTTYLKNSLRINEFKIIVPKIKVNSLLKINGFPCHITGKTSDRFLLRSAVQFYIDDDTTLFLKKTNGLIKVLKDYENNNKKFTVTGVFEQRRNLLE